MSIHPPTAAVCYRHPERSTSLRCSDCGRPICLECTQQAPDGQKCPECAAPAPTVRRATAAGWRASPVTFALMATSIAVFLIGRGGEGVELLFRFGQSNASVAAGEWWRIITASFLHVNVMHLAFNMWALYIFGPPLERQVGSASFGALYFASAAAGGAAAYVLGGPQDLVVGASGAIFGLFGAWVYASYRRRHTVAGSAQFKNLIVLLVLNALLAVAVPGISWQGHAGGFMVGLAIAAMWSFTGSAAVGRIITALAVGVAAIAVVLTGVGW